MRNQVDRKSVEQAISELNKRSLRPTIERIRQITGGSPKTIMKLRRTIETDNEQPKNNNILSLLGLELESRLDVLIKTKVETALQESQKKPDSMIFLSEMRELWLDACTTIEQLRQELESLSRVHQDDRDGLIAYYEGYIKALKDEMGSSTI